MVESSKDSKLSRAEDSILIERIKQGDLSAFDELIARYEKQVYSFAYRMAQNYDDANDIASEAFIKVFQAINKFRGESNFSTWVFRIVTNTYLDKKKRSKAHLNVAIDEYVELDESSVAKQFEDPAPDPLEMMEESERKDIILDAINQLPDYQRIIIDLFHLQGLSYEEIAEVVSLPIGTVKSRLNRARLVLRDILERNRELFNV